MSQELYQEGKNKSSQPEAHVQTPAVVSALPAWYDTEAVHPLTKGIPKPHGLFSVCQFAASWR